MKCRDNDGDNQVNDSHDNEYDGCIDREVERVPVGGKEFLVFLMGSSVSEKAPFPDLDEHGKQDEDHEGHRWFDRQQGIEDERNPDLVARTQPFEIDGTNLIQYGQEGEQPEDYDFPACEYFLGTMVQEIHETRAQEEVHEDVEGKEAFLRSCRTDDCVHRVLRGLGIPDQSCVCPEYEVVEEQYEHQEDAYHHSSVCYQLFAVALVV